MEGSCDEVIVRGSKLLATGIDLPFQLLQMAEESKSRVTRRCIARGEELSELNLHRPKPVAEMI